MLLDSGSTPVTRKAAAEQIGEVQKLHPHELHTLLRKVCMLKILSLGRMGMWRELNANECII